MSWKKSYYSQNLCFQPPPIYPLVEPPIDPLRPPVEVHVSDFSKFDHNGGL